MTCPTFRPAVLVVLLALAGCLGTARQEPPAILNEAEACAVGYDLAQRIHEAVRVKGAVIVKTAAANACERHALVYLERAGFTLVPGRRAGAASFNVDVQSLPRAPGDFPRVRAVATVGDGLRVARSYRPARTGVVPVTPFAVQHLDPDSYGRVDSWKWWDRR